MPTRAPKYFRVTAGIVTTPGTAPEHRLTEVDQADPLGRWRWQLSADSLKLQSALTAGWATATDFFTFTRPVIGTSSGLLLISHAVQVAATVTDPTVYMALQGVAAFSVTAAASGNLMAGVRAAMSPQADNSKNLTASPISIAGVYASVNPANVVIGNAYTITGAAGLAAGSLTIGTNVTITDLYGVYVADASGGTVTNQYGLYLAAQTKGGTLIRSIFAGGGWAEIADDMVLRLAGANTTPPVLHLRKSRNTIASPAVVVTGDILGDLSFEGYDSDGAWEQAALIRVLSEGTIGSGRVPAKLSISLNTDAAPSVLTERLTIDSAGLISLPTATAAASGLQIGGDATLYRVAADTLVMPGTLRTNIIRGIANALNNINVTGAVTSIGAVSDLQLAPGNYIDAQKAIYNTSANYGGAVFIDDSLSISGGAANGQQVNVKTLTELTTIAAAATTDTAIQIPVNAVVFAVQVRVTTVIPTAATFTVTGTTSGTTFNTAAVNVAVNTTDVGTAACPYKNGAAQTIRITPNLTPADNTGRVRVTIHYYDITAATS